MSRLAHLVGKAPSAASEGASIGTPQAHAPSRAKAGRLSELPLD
jgi:hypothetical protein